jgi:hypothetical protein
MATLFQPVYNYNSQTMVLKIADYSYLVGCLLFGGVIVHFRTEKGLGMPLDAFTWPLTHVLDKGQQQLFKSLFFTSLYDPL